MYLTQNNRQYGIDETDVEIAIKRGNVFNGRKAGIVEAFSVNTEKITYLALLYTDSQEHYQGTGFVIFSDGEKWHFFMDERDAPNIREKCRNMARRIARMYQGIIKYGIVNAYGQACWKDI